LDPKSRGKPPNLAILMKLDLSSNTYIFDDSGLLETTRKVIIKKKGASGEVKTEIKTVPFIDNKMRHRVYAYVLRHAGFNPRLLRHARLSSLAHSRKPEHQEKDRMMLVKSIADFKKLESAETYLRNMTDAEKLEVF